MPSTVNTRRRQNAAARKIQAATRAFLAKKYAYTQNGRVRRLAVNKFTGEAIPKSLAIQLRSKNGVMRTWDSLAVYDVVVGGKKVARDLMEYIPLVSAADRTRILELHKLHLDIRMYRNGLNLARSFNGIRSATRAAVGGLLTVIEGILGLFFIGSVLVAIAAAMGPAVLKAVSLHMNVIRYAFARYTEMALIPIETVWAAADSPVVGAAFYSGLAHLAFKKLAIRNLKQQLRAMAKTRAVPGITSSNIKQYQYIANMYKNEKPDKEMEKLLIDIGKRIANMNPRTLG